MNDDAEERAVIEEYQYARKKMMEKVTEIFRVFGVFGGEP